MADLILSHSYIPLPSATPRARLRLVQGVGRNDYQKPVNDDLLSYRAWSSMLRRCYSKAALTRDPSYVGSAVADEWLLFSTYEKWFTANFVEGYVIDKDVLLPGNKIYSAATCVFIPQRLNKLLTDRARDRGANPLGVCFHIRIKKYQASVSEDGTIIHLGYHDTPLEAHKAWQLAKALIIENFPTTGPRIRKALDLRVAQLRDDHANNRITTKL